MKAVPGGPSLANLPAVDTYAETNSNRIIVWTRDLPPGTFTVQIRNSATTGHPRIDFDAIIRER